MRLQLIGQGAKVGERPSAIGVATGIIKAEGFTGLYAGCVVRHRRTHTHARGFKATAFPSHLWSGSLSAAIMRQAVYGTARLGLHRQFSNELKRMQSDGQSLAVWKKVGASMASGAIASVIGNPFDISLVRMQSDSMRPAAERRNYKSVFDALFRIAREEGVVRLWRGSAPTVLRAMAMNVGMMASYDQARELFVPHTGNGITTNLLASATAGFMCAFLSLPPDMIKTRLQSMKADPTTGQLPYRGVADCFGKILRNEGVFAFWRGFAAYYTRCAPHAMIILLTLEQFNLAYSSVFGTQYIR